ncbi:MAG: SprB repeat-containing protein [Flavobacteriales bacterium]|nr:SprB repeat-containing protein [Flavobacteriales bacterium]
MVPVLSVHAQSPLAITLQPSNYQGYQISCFGKQNGSINATISGGAAPYQKSWSNGATSEDLSGLPAGYYKLTVTDADSTVIVADITLNEPTQLVVLTEPYIFPNSYNVSCFDCYNGSIDVTVQQGVPPYTYLWNDSITTTQDRSGLGAKKFFVVVKDSHNCWVKSETMMLVQPERSVWAMGGNTGTTPGQQYIGTADNKDLVFKSNNVERMRIKGNGAIALVDSAIGVGMLYRDVDGVLKVGGGPSLPSYPVSPCAIDVGFSPFWKTTGNDFSILCPGSIDPQIGTLDNRNLHFVTNGVERMKLTVGGNLGIGTTEPEATLHVAGNLIVKQNPEGDIVTSSSDSAGTTLWARNSKAAWGLSIDTAGHGHILGDWNNPHPLMTFSYNKVGIGTENMPGDDFNLFVSKGILAEKVKVKLPGSWPDYVFAEEYRLMPLPELRDFLKRNKHLPGIPSAQELEKDGGIDLGQMHQNLLRTVEDQALYILELEKRVDKLEQIITNLPSTK